MDPVVDRIRKLLALAGSPNVHEAAAAASRAQALATRHRLEVLLQDPASHAFTDGADAPLETSRRVRKWRTVLAAALAEANGCVAYSAQGPDGVEIRLAGRAEDREAARALWDWLVERIQWSSATEGAGRSRRWHEAFRVGAVEAVAERLRAGGDEAREGLDAEALVRVEPALDARAEALRTWVAAHLGTRPGRAMRVDRRAFEQGRVAGTSLPLRRR